MCYTVFCKSFDTELLSIYLWTNYLHFENDKLQSIQSSSQRIYTHKSDAV